MAKRRRYNPFALYPGKGVESKSRKLMKATRALANSYKKDRFWDKDLLRLVGSAMQDIGRKRGMTDTASRECWYAVLLKEIGRPDDWDFCNNGMPDLFYKAMDQAA